VTGFEGGGKVGRGEVSWIDGRDWQTGSFVCEGLEEGRTKETSATGVSSCCTFQMLNKDESTKEPKRELTSAISFPCVPLCALTQTNLTAPLDRSPSHSQSFAFVFFFFFAPAASDKEGSKLSSVSDSELASN
jgi:hypothetical protein